MKVISKLAVNKIRSNVSCVAKLMILFNGKNQVTINRWLDQKDVRLTTPSALEVIKEETGLKDSEILETEKKVGQRQLR